MIRRRLLFATPFVVVACKAPAPAEPRDGEREEHGPTYASMGGDAGYDAPLNLEAAGGIRYEAPPPRYSDAAVPDADRGHRVCCTNPPPPPPNPPPPPPLRTRILRTEVQGNEVIITIGAGTNQNVDPAQVEASVIRGDTDRPYAGGSVTLVRCMKTSCVGKVRLTVDQVTANPTVEVRWKER